MIKIDVEGAEWSVLKGLETALAKLPDTVELAIEIAPRKLRLQQRSPADIFRMLGAAGFHAYHLDNSYDSFSYLIPKRASRLPRLAEPQATKTFDVVFSKVDAEWL